ncbi:MAG: hypothetical protein ACMUHB_02540 [Thermoplasmatota archaeon]
MDEKNQNTRQEVNTPVKIGVAGGALGMFAGLIQLTAGGSLEGITGSKDSPFILGLITIILSGFSLYCVYHAKKGTSKDITKRIAPLIGISIPALVCFTTVGFLWFVPGPLLIVSVVLYSLKLHREIATEENWDIPEIPRWKRVLIAAGVILALSPVFLGWALEPLSLAVHNSNDEVYSVKPMDAVEHEHSNGTVTRSEVTGVLIVHAGLLIGGGVMLVGGQLGSKTVAVGGAVFSVMILLLFFVMIPVIMFNEGAEIDHFSGEHFSALSMGFLFSLIGTAAVMISQFLEGKGPGEAVKKGGDR